MLTMPIATGYTVPACVTQGAMEDSAIFVVPGEPMELAVLWNVSVWKRTPWNAMPKMVAAPANPVTKATDARKVHPDDGFSCFSNNNDWPLFSTIWSLVS